MRTDFDRRYARAMVAHLSRAGRIEQVDPKDAIYEAEDKQERWDLEDIWGEVIQELDAVHYPDELPIHIIKAALQHAYDAGVVAGTAEAIETVGEWYEPEPLEE